MKSKLFKSIKFAIILLLSISLGSCTVLKTHSTKTAAITNSEIIQKPVIVELDVKNVKVTGTAQSISSNELLEETKNNAINDALKNANADVLVEPKFDIETARGRRTVTVTGFPATYKNFQSYTDKDTTLLKFKSYCLADVSKTTTTTPKQKGGSGAVWGVILGVGLVVLGLSSL
jgi:hypothetical protein